MKELSIRKNIRLKHYDYSSRGCYFITICVKDRQEILGQIVGDAEGGVPYKSNDSTNYKFTERTNIKKVW